jgi:cytochrome c-type biogenesis protein CcmH/NrfG
MSKDNFISAVFGILLGFIAGYLMHEVMVARQPPRLPPGMTTVAPDQQAGGGQAPAGAAGIGGPAAGGDPSAAPMMGQVRELQARLDKNPNDVEALQGLAAMFFQINDFKKSGEYLARYVALRPDDSEALLQLANIHFDGKEWPQAQELYTRYLAANPAKADVLSDLGITYRETGQFDRAIELFHKAQELAPDNWQALYNEVVVLAFNQKKYDAAREVLAKLQTLQPNNPDVSRLATEVDKQSKAAA